MNNEGTYSELATVGGTGGGGEAPLQILVATELSGLLGQRLESMCLNRLHPHEDSYLLWPFERRTLAADEDTFRYGDMAWNPNPSIARSDWHGEMIGTWISAASLAAHATADRLLMLKVRGLVAKWTNLQDSDGYLGSLVAADRWKSWDVWIQAHSMLGLLTYASQNGDPTAIHSASRIADLLLSDFGEDRRSIQSTGPHGGMASSAILEPLVWLYRLTGQESYLHFCKWLVDVDWEVNGPAIVSTLVAGEGVSAVGNGKAAEMLLVLSGLVDLFAVTGEERYIKAAIAAWSSIHSKHLYITGSASIGEFFGTRSTLPNDGMKFIGETCVTMAWLDLSGKLGQLTNDAKYFDAIELTSLNHLLAAQSPDGRGWAYYVGLKDARRYRQHTDPECCPTRGSRALAAIPSLVFGRREAAVYVNLYAESKVTARVADTDVTVNVETDYPFGGDISITMTMRQAAEFDLNMRIPIWCRKWTLSVNEERIDGDLVAGYVSHRQLWRPGDRVQLTLDMPIRLVFDKLGNRGHVAVCCGPLVFAADVQSLPDEFSLDDIALVPDLSAFRVERSAASIRVFAPSRWLSRAQRGSAGATRYAEWGDGVYRTTEVMLVPFFEAGSTAEDAYREGVWPNDEVTRDFTYQTWLPCG